MSRSFDQLSKIAMEIVEEALTKGTITVGTDGEDPIEHKLSADQILSVAEKMATRYKKPSPIEAPEDFNLHPTSQEDEG